MALESLAKRIANPSRLGMTPELAQQLRIPSEDVARGQLMAMAEGDRGPIGVYLLAMYVVDDTDVIGAGEIYWWSIPVLLDAKGNASWGAATGLPNGAEPHKCGSLE